MHALEIKGGNLYLDGHLLQGVTGYKLEESVNDSANLTVALYVKDVSVSPSCCNSPEVISPLSALENIGPSYYGVSVKCTEASFLEKLQEIVKEEIAAREERLFDDIKKSIHSDVTDFLAATDGILRGTSE
ncbi:hypothetical protein [Paenibacillus humicus]|uniref:hypothetical protein n=1 Tax=Paenibacillus humicus TaxID=412861 RepID=UPI003D2AE252